MAEKLADLYDQVNSFSKLKRSEYADRYDRKLAKFPTYKVNDLVYVWRPNYKKGQGRKLTAPWIGPFKVRDVQNNMHVILSPHDAAEPLSRVHVSRIKRVPDTLLEVSNISLERLPTHLSDGRWVIDGIRSHRRSTNGMVEYRVHWRGTRPSDDTWESAHGIPPIVLWEYYSRVDRTQVADPFGSEELDLFEKST